MAESAVSFLLDQLSVLLREETQLLRGLEQEVEYIQNEMRQMQEFLRVADQKEESNPSLKEWVRQLREISYDVEDVLDKYMLRFGGHGGTTGFNGRIKKACSSVMNLKARRQIGNEIQAIMKRLQNLSTSQQRYSDMYAVMDQGSSSVTLNKESYDGRGDALFLEDDEVVGIEEPKKKLLEWVGLTDDGLEVISVVGMGGMGKTTLVKKVYDDESVKRGFTSHVWIVASEYPDIKHLLSGGSLQTLWKILSLSYRYLPYYLKHCYLYLSIFPEDVLLHYGAISRLWIAEGFVQSKQDKSVEEVAADYLNELVSRSLIQVAERRYDGRVEAFRIHDLLRDFIIKKSREYNIVTVHGGGGEMQWPSKIRCFAIQKSFNFSGGTYNFECLRSLILCSGNVDLATIKELLSRCRLLKVLDLSGAPLESIPSEVFKLYHLKHLCLRNTKVKLIPKSIKYLEKLVTLDLKKTNVTELPIDVLKLHRLRYLLSSISNALSFKGRCDIGSCFPSMVKLSWIDADEIDGIKMVREIGKLTQLRTLCIVKLKSEDGKELCTSIANLTNLLSLRINSIEGWRLDIDYPLNLPFLRVLWLSGHLEKIPQWIPSLNALTTLFLSQSRVREDSLKCLQDLPNLTFLGIDGADVEGLSFKAQEFLKLKALHLMELKMMKGVIVEEGAMPCLETWLMVDCKMMIDLPRGLEHLLNLQAVVFRDMADDFVEKVVESRRNEGFLAHVPDVYIE